jgi:hypothetical protein
MSLKQGKIVIKKKKKPLTPQRRDEISISGHMAEPETDDNVMESANKVGLYGDRDEEYPEEVGVAEEVVEAEAARRMKKEEERQKKQSVPEERVEITSVDEE